MAGTGALSKLAMKRAGSTVVRPERMMYPGIYGNPREMVAEAASRVAPESPLLRRLFGVNRDDLFQIAEKGTRKGNVSDTPYKTAANPKGAKHISQITNPKNTQRLLDILAEAQQQPELYKGMASWYTMDPAYPRLVELVGPEEAALRYKDFNAFTSMASPGSEVLTELNRGTAANWLNREGRFDDFLRYAGMPEGGRGADFPEDMRAIAGHPYHSTAHGGPMQGYVERGDLSGMGSAKVPSYYLASGVPETGFQTEFPVGDAHFSRLVGLPDVRGTASVASASVPEMVGLTPWFRDKVAREVGLEAVPAQAVVWGAGSGATGVSSPIGAGKLELLAEQIGKTASRLGVSPEEARDMVLLGKTHAGAVDPELLMLMGAGSAGGAGLGALMNKYGAE